MKNEMTSRFRGAPGFRWLVLVLVLVVGLPRAALPQTTDSPQAGSIRQANVQSLVFIKATAKRANGLEDEFTGTGFIVHPDGYVLTCNHVVPPEGTDYANVECSGAVGGRYEHAYPLTVIERNEQRDLMLLKLPESERGPWRSLRTSALAQVDSRIVALGFPLDEGLVEAPGSITGNEAHGRWFTNAGLTFGMSGGPVFDESGAVVGIVTGGHPEARILDLVFPLSGASSLLQEVNSPLLPIPTPTATPALSTPIREPLRALDNHAFSGSKHVRSDVTLQTDGTISATMELENDEVYPGFSAHIVVILLDKHSQELERIAMPEESIDGKLWNGKAIVKRYEISGSVRNKAILPDVKSLKIETFGG
ncbi:MAG: trypsin-like peptidase domain-containing protein [Candidatus Eremiobacteraeota bacterium]|nr:trypsin-like peptidase domain-containing protein [Candidatus Eremiobacteraeota bacterium]